MNNTLFNIDCISKMQSMPDNSIDLIVTDPPCTTGVNTENFYCQHRYNFQCQSIS